jgi:phenylalanyl-tRNA synthetase beta chain
MRTPLSWLKDFADFPDDIELLRATLDDLGLVVEGVEIVGEGLDDVVVARIDEISAIEGADKVRRVVVEAGSGPLEIVCGATNFVLGDLVPLAPVGAVLPGGFAIAQRKMRGVTSNGMLCSGRELGIGDDHAGLLLLTGNESTEPGTKLVDLLGIERDVVFDVTVEGNRPDAWCISGIARDLAARLSLRFTMPTGDVPVGDASETAELVTGEVRDEALCPRLGLAVLTDVVVGDSPSWIQDRLRLAGMRPINNVVDASNYVMLELGQPTHPYDLSKVPGRGLIVRRATPGERLETLDGVTRELGLAGRGLGDTGQDCVICDAEDAVIGIAGIMGGATSEIDATTSEVLLEAAAFDPIAITRTSRRLALRTEASARFQKGSDLGAIEPAIARFASLVALSSSSARLAPSPIVVPEGPLERAVLELPVERVNATLGVEFSAEDVIGLLGPLGFDAVSGDVGALSVRLPTNRPDVRRTHHGIADLIEEVARAYGYSRLPRRFPSWATPGRPSERQRLRNQLREVLCGIGATEAWTASLVSEGELDRMGIDEPEIVISNPLTHDESRLRRSLLPGLARSIGYNAERRQDELALFEIGAVFVHPDAGHGRRLARAGSAGGEEVSLPVEPEIAALVLGRVGDDAAVAVGVAAVVAEALSLVGLRPDQSQVPPGLHPTRSAILVDALTKATLGAVGEIDPSLVEQLAPAAVGRRLAYLELDLDAIRDPTKATRRSEVAVLPSRFPSSDVDLAFSLADEVSAQELIDAVGDAAGALLERIDLFDVYRGPGVAEAHRSLAVRIRLCAQDRTLSEAELAQAREAMITAGQGLGAELR